MNDKSRDYQHKHDAMREERNNRPWMNDFDKGELVYFIEIQEWRQKAREFGNWEAFGLAKDYEEAIKKYLSWIDTCPADKVRITEVQVIGVICEHTTDGERNAGC
ncbi:MAG: hypothetical protein L7S70_01670 [Pseudomonadales bacterium]|nr:hypothetical protein [Pseudomonadales bacterium]